MTLERYIPLIQKLPYLDQAFETKASSWERECQANSQFKLFCEKKFVNPTLKLSRQDLFLAATGDTYEAIILIIFWGYPRNMRGNNFVGILARIAQLQKLVFKNGELTTDQFLFISDKLKGSSIGLSTLSKILYFFEVKIEGSKSLILDRRIIEILNSGLYMELASIKQINEYNKIKLYAEYLTLMNDAANTLKLIPDQLEYFLFHFGQNLKDNELMNSKNRGYKM